MDKQQIYRSALLNNITKMCEYIEKELECSVSNFQYQYERGFKYGWKRDYIEFWYSTKTKKATFSIYHCSGQSIWIDGGKAYDSIRGEWTKDFITNLCGDTIELTQAIEITQSNWDIIKSAVAEHKRKERNTLNFTI